MISGCRNMLQARIDENTEVIKRLIASVPNLIHASFSKAEKDAMKIAKDCCGSDSEVCYSIYNSIIESNRPDDEPWMIEEFYKSDVLLICSYAETTLKSILKDPKVKPKDGEKYIEANFRKVKEKYSLTKLREIEDYWFNYRNFFDKRNNIAHGVENGTSNEIHVDDQELFEAIEGAHKLLRSTADAIDIKERGYAHKAIDYLWTPD